MPANKTAAVPPLPPAQPPAAPLVAAPAAKQAKQTAPKWTGRQMAFKPQDAAHLHIIAKAMRADGWQRVSPEAAARHAIRTLAEVLQA